MTERKALSGGDWLAIGTFLAGALVAVLMAMALLRGVEDAQGTGALAAALAGSFGALPGLLAGAGVAFLGGRAFLTGEREGLVRGLLGTLGVALGLTVLLGAFSAQAGGAFGASTGGRVAELTHSAVGALVGALLAFGSAYYAWMRGDPAAAAKLAPQRRPTSAPPKSDEGVTPAESAMLFPKAEEVAAPKPAAASARHPYPEDVRRKGEIPAGAKPLTPPSAPAAYEPEPEAAPLRPSVPEPQPAVYRWTAPRAAAAAAVPLQAAAAPAPEAVDEEEADDAHPLPPRPAWETTGLSEEDEPVDAYGTPISLVEKVRREREDDEEVAEALAEEVEEETAAAAPVPREIDALSDEELDALTADEEFEEEAVVAELEDETVNGASLEEDEDEEDVEELDGLVITEASVETIEVEEEVAEDLEAELVELEAEDESDEDSEAAVEESDETEVAAADEEELEAAEELEIGAEAAAEEELEPALASDEGPLAEDEPDAEPVEPEPIVLTPAARGKAAEPSLFDAVETGSGAQREVVLQPQAAVPPERAEKSPAHGLDPRHKLLAEIGCMFVERGRVAVSMLQRQYDMDFDDACRVLDELQDMGLIGPYLGGQRRDILLNREQWLEKVGAG